jgi:hypothetical protein
VCCTPLHSTLDFTNHHPLESGANGASAFVSVLAKPELKTGVHHVRLSRGVREMGQRVVGEATEGNHRLVVGKLILDRNAKQWDELSEGAGTLGSVLWTLGSLESGNRSVKSDGLRSGDGSSDLIKE